MSSSHSRAAYDIPSYANAVPMGNPDRLTQLEAARGAPVPGHIDGTNAMALQAAIQQTLTSDSWNSAGPTAAGTVKRAMMIRDCGAPPMRLVHSDAICELGRLPRSDDNVTVDAIEALTICGRANADPLALIVFLSHRWLRPLEGLPDDADNSKAKATVELAKWLKWHVHNQRVLADNLCDLSPGISGIEVFFWVDWACMDQTPGHTAPYIYALPLYTGAARMFAYFDSEDYDNRGWCLVERAMAFAFMFKGNEPLAVPLDFVHAQQSVSTTVKRLRNPSDGDLTVEADRQVIRDLVAAATQSTSFTFWRLARYYCCDLLGSSPFAKCMLWVALCGTCCFGCCGFLPFVFARRLRFQDVPYSAKVQSDGVVRVPSASSPDYGGAGRPNSKSGGSKILIRRLGRDNGRDAAPSVQNDMNSSTPQSSAQLTQQTTVRQRVGATQPYRKTHPSS